MSARGFEVAIETHPRAVQAISGGHRCDDNAGPGATVPERWVQVDLSDVRAGGNCEATVERG